MEIKKINITKLIDTEQNFRPNDFKDFIGQKHIKKTLKIAIQSSIKRKSPLGHILLYGESGYWKTTLAQIIANQLGVNIKIITWYAINKPAEIINILNNLKTWDILFIDEIHRLKPNIEEILYIAMEDFVIDMIMPEWGNVRIPINKFTLIGATTKPEKLSLPFKNRFIYQFHLQPYTPEEKLKIFERYCNFYWISWQNKSLINSLKEILPDSPRNIHNLAIMLRDFIISHNIKVLSDKDIEKFINWSNIKEGGLLPIHQSYIKILKNLGGWPVGLKTIAINLWLGEKAIEEDIEPLLLKLGIIEKTSRWRILKKFL